MPVDDVNDVNPGATRIKLGVYELVIASYGSDTSIAWWGPTKITRFALVTRSGNFILVENCVGALVELSSTGFSSSSKLVICTNDAASNGFPENTRMWFCPRKYGRSKVITDGLLESTEYVIRSNGLIDITNC